MELSPADDPDAMYRTLTSLVIPRPIGWISTLGADGEDNLAPYSYFNGVCSRPPTVMFSGGSRDGEPKDSPRNALETGEFVANLVTEDLIEVMDASSAAHDGSEFDAVGIERVPAATVDPPRVAAAHACLECTVVESVRIGGNTVVFGEVGHIYVDDDLLTDGSVDTRKVHAVGRLGGPYYTAIDVLDFTRTY